MKNIKDLGEKVAIQCKTQEEWDWVTKELGYEWCSANWMYFHKENTCINHSQNGFSSLAFYIDERYTIVQASDFMPSTVNQRIEQLEKELADLKESVRPKKKIEFVKYLKYGEMDVDGNPKSLPTYFTNVELLHKYGRYDIMKAWSRDDKSDTTIYLGHFNDGIK